MFHGLLFSKMRRKVNFSKTYLNLFFFQCGIWFGSPFNIWFLLFYLWKYYFNRLGISNTNTAQLLMRNALQKQFISKQAYWTSESLLETTNFISEIWKRKTKQIVLDVSYILNYSNEVFLVAWKERKLGSFLREA